MEKILSLSEEPEEGITALAPGEDQGHGNIDERMRQYLERCVRTRTCPARVVRLTEEGFEVLR